MTLSPLSDYANGITGSSEAPSVTTSAGESSNRAIKIAIPIALVIPSALAIIIIISLLICKKIKKKQLYNTYRVLEHPSEFENELVLAEPSDECELTSRIVVVEELRDKTIVSINDQVKHYNKLLKLDHANISKILKVDLEPKALIMREFADSIRKST